MITVGNGAGSRAARFAAVLVARAFRRKVSPGVGLQVASEDVQDWTVLRVAGEVDFAVVPELGDSVRRSVAEGRHRIILELTSVEFCDSTGIGALVGARRLLRSCSGELRLVMPGGDHHVNRVFTALGLRRLFDVHPTLAEALAA